MEDLFKGIRAVFRLIVYILILSTFLGWSYICHWTIRDSQKRLKQFSRNTQFFASIMLRWINLELKVINAPPADQKFLLVGNHMGFVDIVALASCFPVLFVTSNEMRETPFLGLITEMGGCIYVERRSRTKILDEMKSMVKALEDGFRVVLYPEATSTNGEKVLPFKKTLMMAAAHARVPIQPVVFNFKKLNGEDFSLKWRDHVCWYGDIPFAVSAWKTLLLDSLTVEIEFLEQIHSTLEDDRGLIADKAHALIAAKFVPVKGVQVEAQAPVEMEADPT